MATNPGQGNTTQGNYVSFPPGGTSTNVYVYTTVAEPIVGTILFWTGNGSVTAPIGSYKLSYPNGTKKIATVNAQGVITALTLCTFNSTKYNNSLYTSTKNNCAAGSCSATGSTVTLNDGNPANTYQTSGSYSSNISQEDADYQAQLIADAAFEAGKQAKVNELGTCTWTYYNGSYTYPATSYTKNNCGGNCYGTSVTYGSVTKTGYAYTNTNQTTGCQGAIDGANAAAYSAAQSESQSLGQANANANGGCCCWNLEYYCTGCQRRSRERNSCTNELRNDAYVADNSCDCGQQCQGTYNYDGDCSGTTRLRIQRYYCNNANASGYTTLENCSAYCGASATPNYVFQNYTSCYACTDANVYKDTNPCSGTYNVYFLYYNGYVNVGGPPTGGSCNTSSNCVDTGTAYCSNGNYVINQTQGNSCSGASCGIRVIQYNSTQYGCYDPCAQNNSPSYTDQGYATCYSCNTIQVYRDTNSCSGTYNNWFGLNGGTYVNLGSGQPTGGSCNTSSNCSDTGSAYCSGANWVINQTQANPCSGTSCGVRVIEYNSTTHGCYTPPSCKTYQIVAYDPDIYVNGSYTNCSGFTDYFSFYGGPGTVGYVCAQPSSVYISQGPGGYTEVGNCT